MKFKQTSFNGGLNLLLDDTRLPVSIKYKEGDSPYDITFDQYRFASNVRSRFDVCTPIAQSVVCLSAPAGLKQGIIPFGRYVIAFIAGSAYYSQVGTQNWVEITGFAMSTTAPRYWAISIPLNCTNYGRQAIIPVGGSTSANAGITQTPVNLSASAQFGTVPGLLVQDGTNQPRFLYIDSNNIVQCRVTQTYQQWTAVYDGSGVLTTDLREYVPVGTLMEFYNGILFVVGSDLTSLYRSVSGRPLDFVVNVTTAGQPGGDATTTSYSVGVGGITAIKAMQGNVLFVAAGGATFLVSLNQTPNSPTVFGEYTFNRQILFSSSCIDEKGIIDISGPIGSGNSQTAGDTVFIAAEGLRSFNAVEQQQNEGRNSVFSSTIQSLFTGITQVTLACSAVVFDNYGIFSVNTTMGFALVVYDAINSCYSSVDFNSLSGAGAKQFAAITIGTLALYAITTDDRIVQLYSAPTVESGVVRLGSVASQDPEKELQVIDVRAIFTNITKDFSVTCHLFVNNRYDGSITEKLKYVPPANTYTGPSIGLDVGTQTNSIRFPFNSSQGWKAFPVISWTDGASLTSVSISTKDVMPLQPLRTQAVVDQS